MSKKRKKVYDSPMQGALQRQIATGKWRGVDMASIEYAAVGGGNPDMFRGMSNRPLTGEEVRSLERCNDAQLAEVEQLALNSRNEFLYSAVKDMQNRRATNSVPTLQRQYITQDPGAIWFTDISSMRYGIYDLAKPSKPTQKKGDVVESTQEFTREAKDEPTITLPKGAVGKVVRVGTTYVYVDFNGLEYKCRPEWLQKTDKFLPDTKLDLSSVIMPEDHRQAIEEAVSQLKHNDKIFLEWGFGDILEKGKAISMLFYGPPGTGKTMCAEMIAKSLGKKLEVIGTGEIQSSEPGQAERNIKAYFEKSKADTMLLFDECDSLVHSRNNTGSIMAAQINALLTALEHYEGIVVFTTNRLGVLDEAFNRRLSLKLHFPIPTKEERLQIWKGMFPEKAPLDKDIKWDKLAELELTGGYIKNIVLRAARSAAVKGHKTITYEVLKNAAKHEVMSKREFEESARQHRRGGVTTIDEAIQDFGMDNKLEVKSGQARTSTRAGSPAQKR